MEDSKSTKPDYAAEYNVYWSQEDRIGESSGNLDQTAEQIVRSCGAGNVLDIGSGEGALVAALLRCGVDARGIDVSEIVVSRANKRTPLRFVHGSVLSLPFDDGVFHTIVSTDCMEHLDPRDVPTALREIHRVANRYVFLKIATTQDRDDHWHLTVEGRAWWEARCFEAGFRKHPAYYQINDYESLNSDEWQICILLEKIPKQALLKYPLAALYEERDLHMDMLRDTGERSDAHVVRYQWACSYIKSGDRVLDAACGLGYGAHVIRSLTQAAKLVGIDGSEYAVNYATHSYASAAAGIEYQIGLLPNVLSSYEDGSFDVIISFETMEHVENPRLLLHEFYRLLTPGGRVIVSVPNDWSDETGEDPNPFHLHVYDWKRLKSELSEEFILENAYAQTASQCKVAGNGGAWERRPRYLRQVVLSENSPADCEWWLMSAMKSPLESMRPYEERVFANLTNSRHPSVCYSDSYINPWLMHSMVNINSRLKNADELERLASLVISASPKNSNDYAAALCVLAYRVFDSCMKDSVRVEELLAKIDEVTSTPALEPTKLRWRVSLLFISAKLLQAIGDLNRAKLKYVACASLDVRSFGIHLATKTTEALFMAGRLAYAAGDIADAKLYWGRGVEYGSNLLSISLDDIVINRFAPNMFNYGDGVREYALSWDNIARCANGLHLLMGGRDIDYASLEGSFQTEYRTVTRDLISARSDLRLNAKELKEVRQLLIERTERLQHASVELLDRTRDLVETRKLLVERTERLESALGIFRKN